ncbi:MAG: META domain-containing protein [Novosphingobium sp.]
MNVFAATAALVLTTANLGALALAGLGAAPVQTALPALTGLAKAIGPARDPGPVDDGTYLGRIDPLGGRWRVERLGAEPFPPDTAWVDFSDAFFLTTTAGCGGGHPAFYRLDGGSIAVTRREAVRIGKCPDRAAPGRERRLAGFIDRAARWAKPSPDRLEITGHDGTRAVLARPIGPNPPQLAGRWRVVALGGRPFVSRRPAEVVFGFGGISATADCNRWGAPLTVSGAGLRIGQGMQTLIGCGAEDQAKDAALFGAVAGARRFVLTGRSLRLEGAAAVSLERFAPPDRRLVGRYAHCGNTVGGVGHGGPVTLAISSAAMTDNAGCTARYTAQGERLTLALGDAPACRIAPAAPEGFPEVGGAISPLALLRPDGFGFSEDGRLFLRTRRGLLSLCRKGEPRRFGD